jgi:hypothetical protein
MLFAVRRNAKCHSTEYRSTSWHNAERLYAQCQLAENCHAECHIMLCRCLSIFMLSVFVLSVILGVVIIRRPTFGRPTFGRPTTHLIDRFGNNSSTHLPEASLACQEPPQVAPDRLG